MGTIPVGAARDGRRQRWVLPLLIALVAISALGRYAYGPLEPFVRRGLVLSAAQFGLISTALTLGSIISAWIAGKISDRVGSHAMLMAGMGTFGAAVIGAGLSHRFADILGWLLLAGAAYGTVGPASMSAVAMIAPAGRLGAAMGLMQGSIPMGNMLGAAVLPVLALHAGWRWGYALDGALLLVLAAVCLPRLAGLGSRGGASAPTGATPEPEAHRTRARGVDRPWRLSLVGFSLCGAQSVLLAFFIPLLQANARLSVVAGGSFLALMLLAGGMARVGLGWVSDRFLNGDRRPVLFGSLLATGALTLLLAHVTPTFPHWLLAPVILVLGVAAVGWVGPYFAAVVESVPAAVQGSSVGRALTTNLIGFGLTPPLAGLVIDHTGGYRLAFELTAGLVGPGLLAYLLPLALGNGPRHARG